MKFHLFLLSFLLLIPCRSTAREIPSCLMSSGEGRSDSYAILVDKKRQSLDLYKSSPQGPQLVKQYRCTTGKDNNGSKHREGDLRTPNGIYFFTGMREDEALPAKYGVRAFVMDYPNDYDRLQDKTGSGIWLHAVDDDSRVEISYDTEGCVVVTNDDILDISDYISLRSTPIIIGDSMLTVSPDEFEKERRKIVEFVENWANAWQNKQIDRYMDCYDERFFSYGRNKARHKAYKERLNRKYSLIRVDVSDISIYGCHNYIVVSFLQEYRSNLFHSKGRKRLYLAWIENGWKIITERMQRSR